MKTLVCYDCGYIDLYVSDACKKGARCMECGSDHTDTVVVK